MMSAFNKHVFSVIYGNRRNWQRLAGTQAKKMTSYESDRVYSNNLTPGSRNFSAT